MAPKWALVTGVSQGGLGDALVKELMAKQFNIIATGPTMTQLEYLPESPSLKKIQLDVTSSTSILAAVDAVQQVAEGQLDVLFNNAGYGYMMPLLDASVDEVRRNFDVNVFGLLAVTQAFFPMLTAAGGMVVNQASIAGLPGICQPFIGSYSASKGAVVDLSNTMRTEFAPFGVKVVTLVTGDVKTQFWNNVQVGRAGINSSSRYWPIHDRVHDMMVGKANPRGQHSAEAWARLVIRDLLKTSPPSHIHRGYLASIMWWVSWLIPGLMLDWIFAHSADLGKLQADVDKTNHEGKKGE